MAVLTAVPARAAEYRSALKIRGVQYDAPGRDSNSCSSGNTDQEYLTLKNYSSSATVNLRGYVVKDAAGNRFAFTANRYPQPGDHIRLRGGRGSDRDTIYLYKPSGSRSDVHSCTSSGSDPGRNGYIAFHK